MMCFEDRAFCNSPGCVDRCGRKLTDELIKEAVKWWGGQDYPVCIGRYCDDDGQPIKQS